MGWAPEGRAVDGDDYAATTGEIWQWVNEKRTAQGLSARPLVTVRLPDALRWRGA